MNNVTTAGLTAGVFLGVLAVTMVLISGKGLPNVTTTVPAVAVPADPPAETAPLPQPEKGMPKAQRQAIMIEREVRDAMAKPEVRASHLTAAQLRAAIDDAPPSQHSANLARIEGGEGTVICLSVRQGAGSDHAMLMAANGQVMAQEVYGLADWVTRGCAAAVAQHGQVMSDVQAMVAVRDLLPNTPAYAEERSKIDRAMLSRGHVPW